MFKAGFENSLNLDLKIKDLRIEDLKIEDLKIESPDENLK